VAGEARTIAAALNHSAFNLGNSMGAALGGAAIAAGLGYLAPSWIGIVLAGLGLVITTISYAVERRSRRSFPDAHEPGTGPITAPIPLL
jgi:MFS transporter, DHA1 family, inner membrane transport protein